MDALYLRLIGESPWSSIEVHPPAGPQSPVAISINSEAGTYWKTDYRYFDPQSLAELPTDNLYGRLADAGTADKLLRMNYDLHTGAVWGLGGKIFMFLMSLLIASLPVTGFAYWYGRRVKKAWRPGRAGARLLPSPEDTAPVPDGRAVYSRRPLLRRHGAPSPTGGPAGCQYHSVFQKIHRTTGTHSPAPRSACARARG